MPRHIPQEKKFLISELKKIAKRKDYSAPSRLNALDRIAHMDGAYRVDLVKPKERPDKWVETKVAPPPPKPAQTPEDVEAIKERVLLAQFHLKHYGGENERTTEPDPGTAGPAVQSPDPTSEPE